MAISDKKPTQVYISNDVLISSAIFARLTAQQLMATILYNGLPFFPLKFAPSHSLQGYGPPI